MDISIKLPTRIIVIGATHTGKTKLITDMILRTDFGRLKQLEISIETTFTKDVRK